jgi:carotenoid cleavage dioxygenase-like enzyme
MKPVSRREFLSNASRISALGLLGSAPFLSHAHTNDWLLDATDNEWLSDDPFLSGNNSPVFKELFIKELKVTGEIPHDLDGVYLRNGPNPKFKPTRYIYPFSGDGMIHGIYFDNGKVYYRNKWVNTERLVNDTKAGQSLSVNTELSNTNVLMHGGKLLSLNDGGMPYELSPELETKSKFKFKGEVRNATAHPRIDPETGEMHYAYYSRVQAPYLTYYVVSKDGDVLRETHVAIPNATMIHDMVLTKNYAVILDCPVKFDIEKAKQGKNPFTWEVQKGTVAYVFNRNDHSEAPIVIKTEPFFVWHFFNGFEKDGAIHIDMVRHDEVPFIKENRTYQYLPTYFHRMSLNLSKREATHTRLDDRRIEYPTIDPRATGADYRFGYSAVISKEHLNKKLPEYFAQSVQYDARNNTSKVHSYGLGKYTGEVAFIPRKNKKSETDGYAISFVFDENANTSEVVILDVANFDKKPLAVIHLPIRVPNGLHGNWVQL